MQPILPSDFHGPKQPKNLQHTYVLTPIKVHVTTALLLDKLALQENYTDYSLGSPCVTLAEEALIISPPPPCFTVDVLSSVQLVMQPF